MNVRQLLDLGARTALVTGGSRGLGLQIAEALGEMGAKIAITARKQNELDEIERRLRITERPVARAAPVDDALHRRLLGVGALLAIRQADVVYAQFVRAFLEQAHQHGGAVEAA